MSFWEPLEAQSQTTNLSFNHAGEPIKTEIICICPRSPLRSFSMAGSSGNQQAHAMLIGWIPSCADYMRQCRHDQCSNQIPRLGPTVQVAPRIMADWSGHTSDHSSCWKNTFDLYPQNQPLDLRRILGVRRLWTSPDSLFFHTFVTASAFLPFGFSIVLKAKPFLANYVVLISPLPFLFRLPTIAISK